MSGPTRSGSTTQAERLKNRQTISLMVCGKCHGPLVEKAVSFTGQETSWTDWFVLCPKGCEADFVTAEAADEQRLAEEVKKIEAGEYNLKPEQRAGDSKALWGEEDE